MGHNCAGADDSTFADDDTGQYSTISADTGAFFDGRAPERSTDLHIFIVGGDGAGAEKNIVFDGGIGGNIDTGLDADIAADSTMAVDYRISTDEDTVADDSFFPNQNMVAGFEIVADDDIGIDDRPGTDAGAIADNERTVFPMAEDDVVIDLRPGAELDRAFADDIVRHWPPPRRYAPGYPR